MLSAREDTGDLPLDRQEDLILRDKRLRRIDNHFIADPDAEITRCRGAEDNRVAVELERAGAWCTNLVGPGELVAVHAKQDRGQNASAAGKEDARVDLGRHAGDSGDRPKALCDLILTGDDIALHRYERHMRLEVEDLLLPDVAETRHDAANDDDDRNAQHHAENRYDRNDRGHRPLRFQILERKE